jgi:hypothetical protein
MTLWTNRKEQRTMSNQPNDDQPTFSSGPSQAEGDRETIEEALGERPTQTSERTNAQDQDVASDEPSQAEGDRETIEESLGE